LKQATVNNKSDDQLLQIVWDYMSEETPLRPADVIVVGGCKNTQLAIYVAELYQTGFAPLIVFSGHAQTDMDITEADLLAQVARQSGVPDSAILREQLASNTGENITFSAALLKEKGIAPKTVILVHQPFMSRRFLATAKAQWPAPQPEFITRHEPTSMVEYTIRHGRGETIRKTLGDFSRMEKYAKKGHQVPSDIPAEVKEAFRIMVDRGHQIR
jgi:uncharacterized SAM-binding protein YcdF (DUF218 family)